MKPNPNRDSDGLLPMVTEIKDLFAIKVRARWLAKKAVVAELKAKNVWVTLVRPAEINERAKAYRTHPVSTTGRRRLMSALSFANLMGALAWGVRIAGWPRPRPTFFARH